MNREDLQKLIDLEVSKIFINMVNKEPETVSEKKEELKVSNTEEFEPKTVRDSRVKKQVNLTEDELDEILFYGGNKPKD
jgi:hypothetical protein